VIALSLMGLMLLLTISLGVLVRTELETASNRTSLTEAQANALLAVNTAVGELQAAAGPDTRVSAAAAIGAAAGALPEGNAFWTGVWRTEGAGGAASYEPIEDVRAWSLAEGPQWLITHGEGVSPDPARPAADLADATVVLTQKRDEAGEKEAVAAGLVGSETGRYAYAVFDNSLLPDATLTPPAGRVDPAAISQEARQNFLSPARSGIPFRTEFAGFDTANPAAWEGLEDVRNEAQASLLPGVAVPDLDSNTAGADSYLGKYAYASNGLLADTRRGGLRKDLTRYLKDGDGLSDNDEIVEPDDFPDLPGGAGANLPRWGLVKSWYDAGSALSGNGGTAPAIRPNTMDAFGIHPLIAHVNVRVGFAYRSEEPAPDNFVDYVVLRVFPRIDLWNPYNVTLPARTYRVRFSMPFKFKPQENADSGANLSGNQVFESGGQAYTLSSGVPGSPHSFNLNDWLLDAQSEPVMTFEVACPAIPPGVILPFFVDSTMGSTAYVRGDPGATPPLVNVQQNSFVSIDPGPGFQVTVSPPLHRDAGGAVSEPFYVPFVEHHTGDDRDGNVAEPAGTQRRNVVVELESAAGQRLQRIQETGARGWVHSTNTLPINTFTAARLNHVSDIGFDIPAGGVRTFIHDFFWFDDQGGSRNRRSNRLWSNFTFRTEELDQVAAAGVLDGNELRQRLFRGTGVQNVDELIISNQDFFNAALNLDNSYGLYLANRFDYDQPGLLERYVFFEVPRTAPGGLGVASLGQLQHVPFGSRFWHHEYAFGNSWAPTYVDRDRAASLTAGSERYDLSYLLNETIWDRYYVSGWADPAGIPDESDFANGVLRLTKTVGGPAEADDFDRAAAFLSLAGAFNVNTTSVEAWKDLLRAGRGLSVPTGNGGSAVGSGEPGFSRFSYPWDNASSIDGQNDRDESDGDHDLGTPENWSGLRSLSEAEIEALSGAIVEEVRARGPFLSLADFVNRRLVADGAANAAQGIKGALQAAIDRVSQPSNPADPASGGILNAEFNYDATLAAAQNQNRAWTRPELITDAEDRPEHALGVERGEYAHRMANIPGFLTQADVLTVIGPRLTARGDTFTIVAYGEATDAITGEVSARARCEVVVQRTAAFVDDGNTPADAVDALNFINGRFGRRFEVIAFRWLDS